MQARRSSIQDLHESEFKYREGPVESASQSVRGDALQNLITVFNAYAKASAYQSGVQRTFELTQEEQKKMRLGFFIKFCRDFKINLPLMQKIKVFNKNCERGRDNEDSKPTKTSKDQNGGCLTLHSFKLAVANCFKEIQSNAMLRQQNRLILSIQSIQAPDGLDAAYKHMGLDKMTHEQVVARLQTLNVIQTLPRMNKPPLHSTNAKPPKLTLQLNYKRPVERNKSQKQSKPTMTPIEVKAITQQLTTQSQKGISTNHSNVLQLDSRHQINSPCFVNKLELSTHSRPEELSEQGVQRPEIMTIQLIQNMEFSKLLANDKSLQDLVPDVLPPLPQHCPTKKHIESVRRFINLSRVKRKGPTINIETSGFQQLLKKNPSCTSLLSAPKNKHLKSMPRLGQEKEQSIETSPRKPSIQSYISQTSKQRNLALEVNYNWLFNPRAQDSDGSCYDSILDNQTTAYIAQIDQIQ